MRGIINNPWKPGLTALVTLASILTVALHVSALLLALAAPHLIPEKIHLPEVYRVELYNAIELPPAPPPRPPIATLAETTPRPAPVGISPPPSARRPLPITKLLPPLASKPLAKPAAVSLSPIKEKLRKESREREEQAIRNRKLADQVTLLKLDLQKQRAEEQAKAATKKAREAIAETYRTSKTRPSPTAESASAKSRAGDTGNAPQAAPSSELSNPNQKEIALATFRSRMHARISPHWTLPEQQDWDKKLTAVIIIKIKADGTVTSTWFEKKSGNTRFDQFVKKAVDRASPLPALPPELGKSSEEIAVTFTPGGLK